jgi:hypothetical protein
MRVSSLRCCACFQLAFFYNDVIIGTGIFGTLTSRDNETTDLWIAKKRIRTSQEDDGGGGGLQRSLRILDFLIEDKPSAERKGRFES